MNIAPRILRFAAVPALLVLASSASGQIVIASDNFEAASHPTGDRTVTAASGVGIPFYTRNATGASYVVGIVTDSGGLGTSVLSHVDNTTSSGGNSVIGVLPMAISLSNPSDYIRLEFSFRFTSLGTANAAGFRFGMHGSNGTAVTGDGLGAVSDNDQGYYIQNGVGTTAPFNNNTFYNESGGTMPLLGGTDRAFVSTQGGVPGMAFNDTLAHTVSFTITRTSATAIMLEAVFDGTTTISSISSTTNIRTVFDEIGFGNGFVTNPTPFSIDNVQVTSNVPEPGAAVALLAGLGVLGLRRGRMRG